MGSGSRGEEDVSAINKSVVLRSYISYANKIIIDLPDRNFNARLPFVCSKEIYLAEYHGKNYVWFTHMIALNRKQIIAEIIICPPSMARKYTFYMLNSLKRTCIQSINTAAVTSN